MATTTEEIAIKLGIKNADLKAALADSGASIKSFKEKGEAGGVSVGNVFGKLADKVTGLKDVTSALAVALGVSLEKIADKIARVIAGLSEAEEEAMKKFAELSTANAEEAIKQIRARGTAEQQYQAALRQRESLQKKINEFVYTEEKLVMGIADEYGREIVPASKVIVVNAQKQLELEQLKSQQLKVNADIVAYESKKAEEAKNRNEEAAKSAYEASVKMRDSARELMSLQERRNSLLSEEEALQSVLVAADKNTKEYAADTNRLLEVQKRIRETNLEIQKGLSLGEKADLELYRLKVKAKMAETDASVELTVAEKARLKTLELQLETQKRQLEINQLYAKMLNGTITTAEQEQLKRLLDLTRLQELYAKILDGSILPSERTELAQLIAQTGEAGKQLRLKLDMIDATDKQAEAVDGVHGGEQKVTTELEKQLALTKQLADEEEKRRIAFDKWSSTSIKQKGDVRNLSDIQLDQLIQNLNKQLGPIKQADAQYFGVGMPSGSYKSIEQYLLQQNLDQAIAERNLRRDFGSTLNSFGDAAAQRTYAPGDYERLKQLFNPDQAGKQAKDISAIANTLKNLFPDQYAGLR